MAKIITYDLRKPETSADYTRLINRIKQYTHRKVTESCWIVSTTWTCIQIRDDLGQYIDSNDRLFVANLTNDAAWKGTLSSTGDELKEILKK
jgi:hypothetical protein